MRSLILFVLALAGTASSASQTYAQLTLDNPQWQYDANTLNYEVKGTGTVTAPNMCMWQLKVKIEKDLGNGNWELKSEQTIGGMGNGAAQNYDTGWRFVAGFPWTPPAGGQLYRVTTSGFYIQNGVKTDYTAVTKNVTITP